MILKKELKKMYQRYNKNYQKEYTFKKEIGYFEKCKKVLDIGCGDGEFVALDKKIHGIDTSRESVRIAKKNGLKVSYGSALKIPFKDSLFDGVHCSHLIEHFYPDDAYKMLHEASRVLKKGGIFLISTPIMWSDFYNDFTHVKPYNVKSITRYLVDEDGGNKSLESFRYKFEIVDLYWRYKPIPLNGKHTYLIANYLYQYGIHGLSKNGYTLILKKK